jgi:hypothetical protein
VISILVSVLPYAVGAALAAPIVAVVTAVILSKSGRPIASSWVFVAGAATLDIVFATIVLVAFWEKEPAARPETWGPTSTSSSACCSSGSV